MARKSKSQGVKAEPFKLKKNNAFALLDEENISDSDSSSDSNVQSNTNDHSGNCSKDNTDNSNNSNKSDTVTDIDMDNDTFTPVTRRKNRNNKNNRNNRNYRNDRNYRDNNEETSNKTTKSDKSESGWSTVKRKKKRNNNRNNRRYDRQNKTGIDYTNTKNLTEAIYSDTTDASDNEGDSMILNTPWRLWIHDNFVGPRNAENKDWSVDSYMAGPKIVTVSDMLKLMHDYESLDKNIAQYFLMRNEIKPIWEDVNNKNGLITSIKINTGNRNGGVNIGSMIYKILSVLTLNESLVKNNEDINGICYSTKNRSVLIKIWVKNAEKNEGFEKELPIKIIKIIEEIADSTHGNTNKYNGSCISVMTKLIEPEY